MSKRIVGLLGILWVAFLLVQQPSCTTPVPSEETSAEGHQDGAHEVVTEPEPSDASESAPPEGREVSPDEPIQETTPEPNEPTQDLADSHDGGDVTPDTPDAPDISDTPDASEPPPEDSPDISDAPDVAPGCKGVGEVVGTGEACCNGLTRSRLYADLQCMPPAVVEICTLCGDGVCDFQKGEDLCSCPKDCKQAAATGACYPKQKHTFTCPDGAKVPWCDCSGKAPCVPECKFIGTRSEGWYNGCDGTRIMWEFCSQCKSTPICDKIGTRSEGWYCDGKLITYEQCAKPVGSWSCIKSPENGCTRCSADKDCKLAACSQFGTLCVEWRETCGGFQLCQRTRSLHPKKRCDSASGACL